MPNCRRDLFLLFACLAVLAGCKGSPASPASPTAAGGPAPTLQAQATPVPSRTPTPAFAVGATASVRPAATVVAAPGTPGLITIASSGAAPATITIQSGRTVTWQNSDSIPHRIVSDEAGLFDTGAIASGATASAMPAAPGVHDWHDAAAPAIKGTIRVLP